MQQSTKLNISKKKGTPSILFPKKNKKNSYNFIYFKQQKLKLCQELTLNLKVQTEKMKSKQY